MIKEMERRGFAPLSEIRFGDGDPQYFVYRDDSEVRRCSAIRYLASTRSYDLWFGAEWKEARSGLKEVLPAFARGPTPIAEMFASDGRPCLSMFSVSSFVGWGNHGLPASRTRDGCREAIAPAFEFAWEPLFLSAATPYLVLSLLLREEAPLKWASSSVFARIAQTAQLVAYTGTLEDQYRTVVSRNLFYLRGDPYCQAGEDFDTESLLLAFRAQQRR